MSNIPKMGQLPTPDLFGGCQNCRIFYLPRIIGKGVVGTMEHEELLAQNAIDGHDLKAWSGGAPWQSKRKQSAKSNTRPFSGLQLFMAYVCIYICIYIYVYIYMYMCKCIYTYIIYHYTYLYILYLVII